MEPSAAPIARRKTYATLGMGALGAAVLAYVGVADPHRPGSLYPLCPFKLLTGWNCPACGGLRMTHDLLHGNLAAAVIDNVFLLAGIPALVAWILWRVHAGRPPVTRVTFVVIAAAALAWTVVRNLPGFPLIPTIYDG